MFTMGIYDYEIYSYSYLLWNKYTKDETSRCPYVLDGLIYTPLDQKYTRILKEQKYKIYKWKPAETNSIDFYIKFQRDNYTKQILNVYDDVDTNENSILEDNEDKIKGKIYRICNLHVGKTINNIEQPELFQRDSNNYLAYLYLIDNNIRDIEGNIIQDNTVVEFTYNNNPKIDEKFRWIPLRTRYDKTESVIKYKKGYGNYSDIANKVWRSIQQNISIDDIYILSKPNTYEDHMKILRSKIDVSVIATERKQDIYYQKITKLGKPLRNFHNWIKTVMINTYCTSKNIKNNKKAMSVLDIGVGRGGDIMKYYNARVERCVGIDPDPNGIYFATDGAISRYNQMKKKFPGFPKMTFLVGDPGVLLNYNDQLRVQGKMSEENRIQISKIFGKTDNDKSVSKFDVIVSQLSIHFLLKDDTIWINFCQNINRYISDDGYMLITTFDGEIIHKLFEKNDGKINSYYTDENGKKQLFFEFIRKYDPNTNNINKTGLYYDSYVAMYKQEGNYDIEYLVSKDFLIKQLENNCGLELVETELFGNIYNMQKHFFENISQYESKDDTNKYFSNVKEFFDQDKDINKAGLKFSRFHRYFIFKKKHGVKVELDPSNIPIDSNTESKKVIKKKDKYSVKNTNI